MLKTLRRRARRVRLAVGAVLALLCAQIHGSEPAVIPSGVETGELIVARVNGLQMKIWPIRSRLNPAQLIDLYSKSFGPGDISLSKDSKGALRLSVIQSSRHEVVTVESSIRGSRGEFSSLELSQKARAPRPPFSWPSASRVERSIETAVGDVTTRVWNVSAPIPRQRLMTDLVSRAKQASWTMVGAHGDAAWLARRADTLGLTVHARPSRAIAVVTWLAPHTKASP